jgi:excisionase family DNA binding protein
LTNNFITTKELAEKLSVAEITIYKWREKGLPSHKFGRSVRFIYEDVVNWLSSQNK